MDEFTPSAIFIVVNCALGGDGDGNVLGKYDEGGDEGRMMR